MKEDQIIKLLEEIRDNQIKQANRAIEDREYEKKIQEEYAAQSKKYQESQEIFKKSQEQYQKYHKEIPKARRVLTLLLGIIAVCMLFDIVLRLLGN